MNTPDDDAAVRNALAQRARLRYAAVLDYGTRAAFVLLVVAFALYVTGILPAEVPLDRLPELWRLPADEFLARTGAARGWAWLGHLPHGEAANLGAITVMVAAVLAAFVAVLPLYLRARERLFAAMTVMQILVTLVAASGLLA
jgi:hypothetical protein